jgi:hypothetical protein
VSDDRKPRHQSQTERDIAGMAARRERQAAPRGVPEFVAEELTGNYEGEELARMRARRPTPHRLALLETKHDDLAGTVGEMRVDVARIDGKLDVLPELLSILRGKSVAQQAAHVTEHETKRLGMANRTKVVLAVVALLGTALGILGTSLAGCT